MIYIVIPVFNRWHFTSQCLESLSNQNASNYEIVVVDHGSTDGTPEFIRENYPNVILLTGNENMWWAAATNMGIRYALNHNASYVLTLNNDVIVTENYLEEIKNSINRMDENTIIGSTAYDANSKRLIFAGEVENWLLETSKQNHLKQGIEKLDFVECSRFPGRGMLIPALVFDKIGLFDEVNFPHYGSDYDFTARAYKNGIKIYCAIKATLYIYPEESGAIQLIKNKSAHSYYNHLFGIKGAAQLKIFYIYALRYCPWYALPNFLFLGTARRILGYWFK